MAPGRAQSPWQRALRVGGLLVTVLSEGHETTRAAVSSAEGPVGEPMTVSEPLALSKAISIALNKRPLTVARGVLQNTELYRPLPVSVPLPLATFWSKQACWGMEATGGKKARL